MTSIQQKIRFFTALVALSSCLPFHGFVVTSIVKNCASGGATGTTYKIQLNNCDLDKDDNVCELVRGEKSKITVDFSASKELTVAKLRVGGKKGSMFIPFPLKPEDACGNWGFDCPVKANEHKQLVMEMPILKVYPKMSVEIQLRMVDENEKDILCFSIPSKIVDLV